MPRLLRWVFVVVIALVVVGGPLAYRRYQATACRNFHVVTDGVLYRSGQMTLAGLERQIYDRGIKTVVTLRDAERPGDPPPDLAEEEFCRNQEIKYIRLTPRAWQAPDGSVPARPNVDQFRAVMADPGNYPVLVHCFAGKHRTGAYVAVYRMEHQGWSNARAIAEVKELGYDNLDDEQDILGFLTKYQPGQPIAERYHLRAARLNGAAPNQPTSNRGDESYAR